MQAKNIMLVLSAAAAAVLVAAVVINSGILKISPTDNSSVPGETGETGEPVSGTYNFKGVLTGVKEVSGGTEITVEWEVDSTKIEKRTLLVTSSTKVTRGAEGAEASPSSASDLTVGDEVVIEATFDAETGTWTTNSVQILE